MTEKTKTFSDPEHGVSPGAEFEKKAGELLGRMYKKYLQRDEYFKVSAEVNHHMGYACIELSDKAQSFSMKAEALVDCEANEIDNPMDALDRALDCAQEVFEDYFRSDRILHFLPVWQEFQSDEGSYCIKAEHCFKALDDEADAFLAKHGFDAFGEKTGFQ